MAENVENLVLEQLRPIREKLGQIEGRLDGMAGDIKDLKAGQNGQTGMIMALAGYVRDIDLRVEHLEQTIGGPR